MIVNDNKIPLWPPLPGLLDWAWSGLDFSKKNEWGKDEWRTYAMFLETRGAEIVIQLCNTEVALIDQKKKASRRQSHPKNAPRGLLSSLNPGPKRGPKKSDNLESIRYAEMALAKRAALEADGQKVTDSQALESVFNDLKLSRSQKLKIGKRNIFNRISSIRKSQN